MSSSLCQHSTGTPLSHGSMDQLETISCAGGGHHILVSRFYHDDQQALHRGHLQQRASFQAAAVVAGGLSWRAVDSSIACGIQVQAFYYLLMDWLVDDLTIPHILVYCRSTKFRGNRLRTGITQHQICVLVESTYSNTYKNIHMHCSTSDRPAVFF